MYFSFIFIDTDQTQALLHVAYEMRNREDHDGGDENKPE